MTLREPTEWADHCEFFVRCRCKARYRSRARVLVDDRGRPFTETKDPCPGCLRFDNALELSTEEHKG